jgi:hypothetical protein
MRRLLTIAVLVFGMIGVAAGPAFAHYCANVSKKSGAGNAGVLFITIIDEFNDEVDEEKTTIKLNRQGRITGGFIDIHVDLDANGTADFVFQEVFAQASLPHQALLAAGCGKAIETNIPFFLEYCEVDA